MKVGLSAGRATTVGTLSRNGWATQKSPSNVASPENSRGGEKSSRKKGESDIIFEVREGARS